MTLIEQLQILASKTRFDGDPALLESGELVVALAVQAFLHDWPKDSVACRAIKRALVLKELTGAVPENEPRVA